MELRPPENNNAPFSGPRPEADKHRFAPYALKGAARRIMDSDRKNVTVTAACYLLLTTWLRTLFLLFCPNPVTDAMETLSLGLDNLYTDLSKLGAAVSAEAIANRYAAVVSQAWGALREGLASGWGLTSAFLLILILLTGLIVEYGMKSWALRRVRGEYVGAGALGSQIYLAGSIILLTLLIGVTVCLWLWLLLLPAIYIWYRLRVADFLLLDCQGMSAWQAYGLSGFVLRGYKWQLFKLDVSFFGWLLLAGVVENAALYLSENPIVYNLLSLAAGSLVYLYVEPYRSLSYAKFYDELKNATPQLREVEEALAKKHDEH